MGRTWFVLWEELTDLPSLDKSVESEFSALARRSRRGRRYGSQFI